MTSRLYPHQCDIKRNQAVGTNGRKQKVLLHEGVRCLLVPMASRAEIEAGFTSGSGYDAYFASPTQDVKAADQLEWDGATFNVRAVRAYAVPGVGHTHCLVTREGV